MKKYILLLAIALISSSCAVFYGDNYNNSSKIQKIHLGMTKQEVFQIMGNKYIIESTSQEEDGLLEVFKFYSVSDVPYLLHFLNGELILFNRFYPPHIQEQKVIIKKE
ncbi:hypothetical protein [Dysgonomonas sp. BGC7]|uniref:hypothetical protein n=1 Tax=Dysgonomonas sp. BGC7 TaxID=1658008 RepID=UPI0006832FEC|nr:hypothetical protein [Dysgonomonas sp. BGC7]MBD8388939.1 hypothetical protein [Dysgonomonas sp. BGC7]